MRKQLAVCNRVVTAEPDGRITVATDGAVSDAHLTMGYLTSHGHYGMSVHPYHRIISGPARSDVAELRAIMFALEQIFDEEARPPLRFLIDSQSALMYLRKWKAGERRMPPGYHSTRPRPNGTVPTLIALSRKIHRHQMITFRPIQGHAGHPLNETADSLAKLGLRFVRGWGDAGQAQKLALQWAKRGHAEYAASPTRCRRSRDTREVPPSRAEKEFFAREYDKCFGTTPRTDEMD